LTPAPKYLQCIYFFLGGKSQGGKFVRAEFQKWGNSLALRVPSAFAKEIGAAEGQAVDMTIENGALVVKITTRKHRRYVLEQLIGEITEENRHGETSWGPPVGNEVW
jgi:antitoxin MazE